MTRVVITAIEVNMSDLMGTISQLHCSLHPNRAMGRSIAFTCVRSVPLWARKMSATAEQSWGIFSYQISMVTKPRKSASAAAAVQAARVPFALAWFLGLLPDRHETVGAIVVFKSALGVR